MAISCEPANLATAAACYDFDHITREKVKIYLLAVIAGKDNLSPSELAEAAKCYCLDAATMKKVLAYLICEASP